MYLSCCAEFLGSSRRIQTLDTQQGKVGKSIIRIYSVFGLWLLYAKIYADLSHRNKIFATCWETWQREIMALWRSINSQLTCETSLRPSESSACLGAFWSLSASTILWSSGKSKQITASSERGSIVPCSKPNFYLGKHLQVRRHCEEDNHLALGLWG